MSAEPRSYASDLADALAQRIDEIVPELLPAARSKGGYWQVGSVANDPGASLYIHRTGSKTGQWSDSATGQFGDLLDLVNEVIGGGRDMPQAMRWVKARLGIDGESLSSIERRPRHVAPAQSAEDEAAIGAARGIWCKAYAIGATRGETYFRHRGITIDLPPTLRFQAALLYPFSGLHLAAVVAAISGPDHKATAIQRIFIRQDGRGKAGVSEQKLTLGRMLNGAVRLAPAGATLGLAEGVETGLSAMQLHSVPVWAACGSRMDAIAIPDDVERLVIFADNGAPGVKAAERAAIKHARDGRGIEIAYPPAAVKDWNDQLQAERQGGRDAA